MVVLTLAQGAMGLAVGATLYWPTPEVWLWILASGAFHMAYQFFLTFAYDQGDLSRVYPIARGFAPLVVLVIGAIWLADQVEVIEYAGVSVLGLGILLMAHGALSSGEGRKLVPFALGSACATAGYTLVDGLGARVSGAPVAYVGWLLFTNAVLFTVLNLLWRGPKVFRAPRAVWIKGTLGGAASYASYAIAVWAMTLAPIALVAAIRETSILFAVLIGWAILGERIDRWKALAALLIVGGVVLTRL
jgi:drug/metabolite transporter (DMT)-like permease